MHDALLPVFHATHLFQARSPVSVCALPTQVEAAPQTPTPKEVRHLSAQWCIVLSLALPPACAVFEVPHACRRTMSFLSNSSHTLRTHSMPFAFLRATLPATTGQLFQHIPSTCMYIRCDTVDARSPHEPPKPHPASSSSLVHSHSGQEQEMLPSPAGVATPPLDLEQKDG